METAEATKQTEKHDYKVAGIILFLLSLCYVISEFVFNVTLLDVSANVNSTPDEVDAVQYFGRAVSASGFTLLILGLFVKCGFRLHSWREWGLYALVALFCSIPFLMTLNEILQSLSSGQGPSSGMPLHYDVMISMFPQFATFLVVAGRGMSRVATIAGIVMLAWPSMFFGQHILIERFVVAQTTWEQRLNARYILMLRAGIEDCIIEIEGFDACAPESETVQARTVRAVLGAYFMHAPARVIREFESQRKEVIKSFAIRQKWFSPSEDYRRYVDAVADTREKYQDRMIREFYVPYKKASDTYMRAVGPKSLANLTEKAWRESERQHDEAWQAYQDAVAAFRDDTDGLKASDIEGFENPTRRCRIVGCADLPRGHPAKPFCASHVGVEVCTEVDLDEKLHDKVIAQTNAHFEKLSGYPPDIGTRAEFIAHPRTRAMFRQRLKEQVEEDAGIEDFEVPDDFVYGERAFKDMIADVVRQKATERWNEVVDTRLTIDVPPGLGPGEFFEHLGIDPLPPLEDIVMSRQEFVDRVLVANSEIVVYDTLESIIEEAPKYANGEELSEEGKDYIRAIYIPVIALGVSLVILFITLGRNILTLIAPMLIEAVAARGIEAGHKSRLVAEGVFWTAYAFCILSMSYALPAPQVNNDAYQKYYGYAVEAYAPTAVMIDWTVRVQPYVYQPGRWIKDMF